MFLIQVVTSHQGRLGLTNQGLRVDLGRLGRGDLDLAQADLGLDDRGDRGDLGQAGVDLLVSNRRKSATRVVTRKWTMAPTRDRLEVINQLILAGLVSLLHLFLQSRQSALPSCHSTQVINTRVNTSQRKRHQTRVVGYLSTYQDFWVTKYHTMKPRD